MVDFLKIGTRMTKKGIEIYPKFRVGKSSDLMIRGRDFYAIWLEDKGLWSTDEQDVIDLIDRELDIYAKKNEETLGKPHILYMWDSESGMIDGWHRYCQKQMRDSYHALDERLIFANDPINKEFYASKRLPYPLQMGNIDAYEQLISTLYSEEERHKIEWTIGSIVSGDSKKLQKFAVLYGSAGTGKSTILNVIQMLFDGYYSVFDAKALGSSNNSFALEAFKSNPLVAIQHDGDLSKIEDNTRLNSLVSHEEMTVNEKFKATYTNSFKCFLYMGTNKPVKITDAKSGLIRRLIDISPSGNKIPQHEYRKIMKQIPFELGAIASHCLEVYKNNPSYYDDYIPLSMIGASNDFYNYILDSYNVFSKEDCTTLKTAWEMYRVYIDYAKVPYPLSQRAFKEELKNYFREYEERHTLDNGNRVRSFYSGFISEKFEDPKPIIVKEPVSYGSLIFSDAKTSLFDDYCADCHAQYANADGIPLKKWDYVTDILRQIDPTKLHFVKVPENHIVIDFDIPGTDGTKSLEANLKAASQWPATYAELSKSGCGVHLHYIYDGDPSTLSRIFDEHIEIKVFTGKSSLRRKLTKCNDIPIAHLNSGLPLKGETKMVEFNALANEKALRTVIIRNLKKEYHKATKPSIDFIHTSLERAYNSGMHYDVSDMYNDIFAFAAQSTHNAQYCMSLVGKMKFKSDDIPDNTENVDDEPLVFYDIEVFPNLFVLCYKFDNPERNEKKDVVFLINPKPVEIESLLKYKLVGFNNRRYDNHIIYAALMGYNNEQLYNQSQKIIQGAPNCFFGEAYNLSYTDIYDFASAGNKKSLKKLEIEMGIHHQELGLPWDQPVDESLWYKVADYCCNDVIATQAAFHYLASDWTARQILADITGMTVNDTTNTLSTRFIFGTNKKPQNEFNYRNMGDTNDAYASRIIDDVFIPAIGDPEYTKFDSNNRPVFPGYSFERGVSTYRGEEVGEGGYVYAEPGIHYNVALLDIASMHPSSIIAEQLFGPEYTQRFQDIKDLRVLIKHKEFDKAKKMFNGALAKYLDDPEQASSLANALKTVINSVYGLTSAKFDNPFHDIRNVDNIVAKRGALFMVNLKHEVQNLGFTVAHIKTDSIKIPNATPEIIQFVMDYGAQYGYTFEHEATYEKMCLVNNAVYIARYSNAPENGKHGGEWTATGKQFAVPYIFKRLFTKEEIEFDDLCETFASPKSALYLDLNEHNPDIHDYKFVGKVGQFCPIKPGKGGGLLMRENGVDDNGDIKYAAAAGTTGYRWLDSELVRQSGMFDVIDKSYHEKLASDAIEAIEKYGNYDSFIA